MTKKRIPIYSIDQAEARFLDESEIAGLKAQAAKAAQDASGAAGQVSNLATRVSALENGTPAPTPGGVEPSLTTTPRGLVIATAYAAANADNWVTRAQAMGVNMMRVTNVFEDSADLSVLSAPASDAKWVEVRKKADTAVRAGIAWLMDLSYIRNILVRNGVEAYKPTAYAQWDSAVRAVLEAIRGAEVPPAMISIAGEAEADTPVADLVGLYEHVRDLLRAEGFTGWISGGGGLHLGTIDYRRVFAVKGLVPAVHVYTDDDLRNLPRIAAIAAQYGGVLIEETGAEVKTIGDAAAGAWFDKVRAAVEPLRANVSGVGLWNLGADGTNHDIIPTRHTLSKAAWLSLAALVQDGATPKDAPAPQPAASVVLEGLVKGSGGAATNTPLIQAALDDPNKGEIILPAGFFEVSSLVLSSNTIFRGQGRGKTTIFTTGSDPLMVLKRSGGPLDRSRVAHMTLRAEAGHIFDAGNIRRSTFDHLELIQRSAEHSVLFADDLDLMLSVKWHEIVSYVYGAPRTVPAWSIKSSKTDAMTQTIWDHCVFWNHDFESIHKEVDTTQPQFLIESTVGVRRLRNNVLSEITLENAQGGGIVLASVTGTAIKGLSSWDIPTGKALQPAVELRKSPAASTGCQDTLLERVSRVGFEPAEGVPDIRLESQAVRTTISTCYVSGSGRGLQIDLGGAPAFLHGLPSNTTLSKIGVYAKVDLDGVRLNGGRVRGLKEAKDADEATPLSQVQAMVAQAQAGGAVDLSGYLTVASADEKYALKGEAGGGTNVTARDNGDGTYTLTIGDTMVPVPGGGSANLSEVVSAEVAKKFLVLGADDEVPPGTAPGTVIIRESA